MKKLFAIIIFTFVVFPTFCDDNQTPLERKPFKLKLAIDEDNYWEWEVPKSALIIKDGNLQIYPGETIYLEVIVQDGKISAIKAVESISNPEITLKITFKQVTDDKDSRKHNMMMLSITNPFNKELNYDAVINGRKNYRFVQVQFCGKRPKTDFLTVL